MSIFHLTFWTFHIVFKLISLVVVGISFFGWLAHAQGKEANPLHSDNPKPTAANPAFGILGLVHLLPVIYILMH